MAIWPASLPQYPLIDNWQESPRPNAVVFSTDVGPGMSRQRSTAAGDNCSATFPPITNAQRETFLAFFRTTLASGVQRFEWADPVDGEVRWWQFDVENQPYDIRTMFSTSPGRHTLSISIIRLT